MLYLHKIRARIKPLPCSSDEVAAREMKQRRSLSTLQGPRVHKPVREESGAADEEGVDEILLEQRVVALGLPCMWRPRTSTPTDNNR